MNENLYIRWNIGLKRYVNNKSNYKNKLLNWKEYHKNVYHKVYHKECISYYESIIYEYSIIYEL